ncbi:hypothetical protein SBOR_5738 [Sclerotinia borealis F-4128]|uniref:Uncharacterized protein n=1 Tax=Sclerotinia borealis (strain F-4128) TaxID=1432307 RepID=W9CH87_SCLBF|nr:hypothetical protein SBOR_5738 [Sclerotinia borealis F-4128]
MCLCSDIQHGFTQPSDNQEFVGDLEVFLTQLYTYISRNEQSMSHLPFILQKRSTSIPSTASEPSEVHQRIAKIYSKSSLGEADNDMQSLVKTIETLLQAGPRYENIAEKLALGACFSLEIWFHWEKWLTLRGPVFEQAMSYLMDKGIVGLGKEYEKLAEEIFHSLDNSLPKFEPSSKRKPSHQLGGRKKKNTNNTTKDISDNSGSGTGAEPTALDDTTELIDQLRADSPGSRAACNSESDQSRQDVTVLPLSESDPGTSTTICVRAPGAGPAPPNSIPISSHALLRADVTTSIYDSLHAESTRQMKDIRTLERNTPDSSIGATSREREIEFVYSNPDEDQMNISLKEPFRSAVMAKY